MRVLEWQKLVVLLHRQIQLMVLVLLVECNSIRVTTSIDVLVMTGGGGQGVEFGGYGGNVQATISYPPDGLDKLGIML